MTLSQREKDRALGLNQITGQGHGASLAVLELISDTGHRAGWILSIPPNKLLSSKNILIY